MQQESLSEATPSFSDSSGLCGATRPCMVRSRLVYTCHVACMTPCCLADPAADANTAGGPYDDQARLLHISQQAALSGAGVTGSSQEDTGSAFESLPDSAASVCMPAETVMPARTLSLVFRQDTCRCTHQPWKHQPCTHQQKLLTLPHCRPSPAGPAASGLSRGESVLDRIWGSPQSRQAGERTDASPQAQGSKGRLDQGEAGLPAAALLIKGSPQQVKPFQSPGLVNMMCGVQWPVGVSEAGASSVS